MDVSTSSLVPRLVPDLRPSADVAASARLSNPAPALPAAAAGLAPASPAQGALVARGLLDPRAVTPTGAVDTTGEAAARAPAEPPPRVLKPWGVPMLPTEERRTRDEPRPEEGPEGGEAAPPGEAPRAAPPAELPLLPRGLVLPGLGDPEGQGPPGGPVAADGGDGSGAREEARALRPAEAAPDPGRPAEESPGQARSAPPPKEPDQPERRPPEAGPSGSGPSGSGPSGSASPGPGSPETRSSGPAPSAPATPGPRSPGAGEPESFAAWAAWERARMPRISTSA